MDTRDPAPTTASDDQDIRLGTVRANGVPFAYLELGTGPLIMFLHGFPDNAWSYAQQMRTFANAGYRTVAPFLRGYAPTGFPADGVYDPIALGRDLEALVGELGGGAPARVVGMDWGGTSILQALATAPSTIRAAVVMNTAHPITFTSIRKDPDAVRSLFHFYFFQIAGAEASVDIEGLPFVDYLWELWSPSIARSGHLASVKETLSSPGTLGAALKYYAGLFDAGSAGRLPMNRMSTPTLTVYGSNDPTCRYAAKEEPYFTGPYRRVVLPDVGHFPHLEREAEVTGLIADWFDEHG